MKSIDRGNNENELRRIKHAPTPDQTLTDALKQFQPLLAEEDLLCFRDSLAACKEQILSKFRQVGASPKDFSAWRPISECIDVNYTEKFLAWRKQVPQKVPSEEFTTLRAALDNWRQLQIPSDWRFAEEPQDKICTLDEKKEILCGIAIIAPLRLIFQGDMGASLAYFANVEALIQQPNTECTLGDFQFYEFREGLLALLSAATLTYENMPHLGHDRVLSKLVKSVGELVRPFDNLLEKSGLPSSLHVSIKSDHFEPAADSLNCNYLPGVR